MKKMCAVFLTVVTLALAMPCYAFQDQTTQYGVPFYSTTTVVRAGITYITSKVLQWVTQIGYLYPGDPEYDNARYHGHREPFIISQDLRTVFTSPERPADL